MSDPSDAARYPAARVEIYDTTLRDGSQLEGISLTVDDKLRIAEQLDWLGVDYIEAGWPGANPKDDELFRRASSELALEHSMLVAFGSTRRPKGKVDSDDTLRHLLDANTVDRVHRRQVVGLPRHRGAADHARRGRGDGRRLGGVPARRRAARCFFDAEHFFDGYRRNPEFGLRVLEAAAQSGRDAPRAVRHERRHAAARRRADRARGRRRTSAPTSASRCTSTTTPAPAWPTRSPA